MKRYFCAIGAVLFLVTAAVFGQVPVAAGIQILKAEDARRYDSVLENLMRSPNAEIRKRAALAAGRIGDERAIPGLSELLAKDADRQVRAMAAFALGETESIKAADAILLGVTDPTGSYGILARVVEAAGKIAAANPKEEKSKALGAAVLDCLNSQLTLKLMRDNAVVRLGLTAALRARPSGAETVVAKFLTDPDARIRADAANTLSRLRAKSSTEPLRTMLATDPDADARANAARALGAAEDRNAFGALFNAFVNDTDPRVRVSAIRGLVGLKDPKAANRMIERGNDLLASAKRSKFRRPVEVNELLEIATALGRLQPRTEDQKTIAFLSDLRKLDGYSSSETEIAFARVAPKAYLASDLPTSIGYKDPHAVAAFAQGLADIAATKDATLNAMAGEKLTAFVTGMGTGVRAADQKKMLLAMPEITTALAALKPDNIDEILRGQLTNADVFIRAAAASAMAERPVTDDNIEALKKAYVDSMITDKANDDASIAILDALMKLDKNRGFSTALLALYARNYIVRKKAFELLADKDLQAEHPGIPLSLEAAAIKHQDQVLPYEPVYRTKLGQVLNTDLDYRRALGRKNGSVSAVLATEKGVFTIVFNPEEAPLTVDNFIKLARSGYFNGLEVHRVVPNFVMQDGDPRGDGNGGPGWSIRCEINMLPYDRGAVGMALSGKDTGGSQWFVTHSPQPHLDGGYTVFGKVDEAGMKVVDTIVRGDKIVSVRIVGR